MSINHTKVGHLENAIKADILTNEVGVLHVLSVANQRHYSCVESLN
jgi:hypothetical protein